MNAVPKQEPIRASWRDGPRQELEVVLKTFQSSEFTEEPSLGGGGPPPAVLGLEAGL